MAEKEEKMKIWFWVVAGVVAVARAERPEETILYGDFPADFIWAAATASYQVEGGSNVGGETTQFQLPNIR